MTLEELILDKLDNLCKRISKIEEKLDNHLQNKINKAKTKREIILTTITITSTIIAIYEIIS